MDKKILLSSAAALLLVGSMHATTASAAVTFSHSGEAELTATFSDTCATAATTLTADADATTTGAFADFLGISYTPDDDVAVGTNANQIEDALDAINGFTNDLPADLGMTGSISFAADPCGGASADNPVWATDAKLEWEAGGTLANGLGISVGADGGEGVAIGLSGAFGSLTWEKGGDSAVKAALPNGDGDLDVTGPGLGGHTLGTDGSGGYNINWQAPSVGGMDIFVTYTPSSGNSALNDDPYLDTLAVGASMAAGDITIGAGYESATANSNAASPNACATAAALGAATAAPLAHANAMLEGDFCGDITLMGIGASMDVSDISINAGYTSVDSDGGDKVTYNVGLGTSVGNYSVSLDYVNSTLDYLFGTADADTVETVIGVGVETSLGDGVDFSVQFNNQTVDVLSTGGHSNYNAVAKLVIAY